MSREELKAKIKAAAPEGKISCRPPCAGEELVISGRIWANSSTKCKSRSPSARWLLLKAPSQPGFFYLFE